MYDGEGFAPTERADDLPPALAAWDAWSLGALFGLLVP